MEFQYSPKLKAFADKVQQETGKPIKISIGGDRGLPGMGAAVSDDPNFIDIRLAQGLSKASAEEGIAHELMHALIEKRGFKSRKRNPLASKENRDKADLVWNAIADVTVTRLLAAEVAAPFDPAFAENLAHEDKSVNHGRDPYRMFADQPEFRTAFIAYRYALAWSLSTYLPDKFSREESKSVRRYMRMVQFTFPKAFVLANSLVSAVEKNDVMTPSGFEDAFNAACSSWDIVGAATLVP